MYNLKRIKKYFSYKYLIILFYLKNILYAKKWVYQEKCGTLSFIKSITPVVKVPLFLTHEKKTLGNLSYLKKRLKNGNERKNIVFIERGITDNDNKIKHTNSKIYNNSSVKEIQYLSNFQKNFIYLLERNNNVLVHAKTSSGKTTICLLYFILKFYFNCEFIFEEDLDREKYINWKELPSNYKTLFNLNKHRKVIYGNKLKYTPFSEKYAEIYDIKDDKNLLLEEKAKCILNKGERILILCPSKELCVQISQNILSLIGKRNEQVIKLFIDKHLGEGTETAPTAVEVENGAVMKEQSKRGEGLQGEVSTGEMSSGEEIPISRMLDSNFLREKKTKISNEGEKKKKNLGKNTSLSRNDKSYMNNIKQVKEDKTNNQIENMEGVLFLVGTPQCFKNYVLNLEKEKLKQFLQCIKYIFFDEIDKLFPSTKKRKLVKKKCYMKKKTAYFILQTIMYMNKKNLIFVGCSSTLNRELHRRIFKLIFLNRNNAKKKIYLLRERSNLSGWAGAGCADDSLAKVQLHDPDAEGEMAEPDQRGRKSHVSVREGENDTFSFDEKTPFNTSGEESSNALFELNNEDSLQKYVIKVRLPENIYHFYHIVNDQLYSSKIKAAYEIVERFKTQKILVLIKNGYSLLQMKKYLSEKNVFSQLLHEQLQISLRGNDKQLGKMCENYERLKNLKEISTNEKGEGQEKEDSIEGSREDSGEGGGKNVHINKFPVIISSFDNIRGFHINDLDIVILCNKPKNVNEYIHLCGRVGRRGKDGFSVMLEDEKNIHAIKNWLTNIKVNFNKLHWKKNFENVETNMDEKKKEEKKNNLDYITSCILHEFTGDT
ncbi:DEAD box helicase, putative [Plasmodium ovale curtisi]|uniref:DEAD box helicase, putative n=1 Tax=Plasmodium ovale curtisi TaxID=864141 RepID=A0A1A8X1G3_PLAOA|nr:DEAD box helicase, putative [Plasmodium ovale curtisi]SBS98002.1 DEAD box helicase, putative [Plasmodium ovale curtisi]